MDGSPNLLNMITARSGTSKSCASCKHQRRKCTKDCILAPYFPADQPRVFHNAHRLFGVSNMQRLLKIVDPNRRDKAMETIIYEANVRAQHPVHGCVAVINQYQNFIEILSEELHHVYTQIAICKEQGTAFHVHGRDDNLSRCDYDPHAIRFQHNYDHHVLLPELQPNYVVEDFYNGNGNNTVSFDLAADDGHYSYLESLGPSNSSSASNSSSKDEATKNYMFEQGSSAELGDIAVANFSLKGVKDEFASQALIFNGASMLEEGLEHLCLRRD